MYGIARLTRCGLLWRRSVLEIENSGANSAGWGNPAEHPSFHLVRVFIWKLVGGQEQPSRRQPSVAELILDVRERFRAEFAERLAKRLDYLAKISQEEYTRWACRAFRTSANPIWLKSVSTRLGTIRQPPQSTVRSRRGMKSPDRYLGLTIANRTHPPGRNARYTCSQAAGITSPA